MSASNEPNVKEVDFSDRSRKVEDVLRKVIDRHLTGQGKDLAGFAVVTWDGRGCSMSGFYTSVGPIDRALMPTYVHDVLNRHVAADIAQESAVIVVPPDEPA